MKSSKYDTIRLLQSNHSPHDSCPEGNSVIIQQVASLSIWLSGNANIEAHLQKSVSVLRGRILSGFCEQTPQSMDTYRTSRRVMSKIRVEKAFIGPEEREPYPRL